MYDVTFSKIFLAFAEGCFGVLTKAAENNEAEEEEDENGKKEGNLSIEKKIPIEMILSPYYHSSPIVLVH